MSFLAPLILVALINSPLVPPIKRLGALEFDHEFRISKDDAGRLGDLVVGWHLNGQPSAEILKHLHSVIDADISSSSDGFIVLERQKSRQKRLIDYEKQLLCKDAHELVADREAMLAKLASQSWVQLLESAALYNSQHLSRLTAGIVIDTQPMRLIELIPAGNLQAYLLGSLGPSNFDSLLNRNSISYASEPIGLESLLPSPLDDQLALFAKDQYRFLQEANNDVKFASILRQVVPSLPAQNPLGRRLSIVSRIFRTLLGINSELMVFDSNGVLLAYTGFLSKGILDFESWNQGWATVDESTARSLLPESLLHTMHRRLSSWDMRPKTPISRPNSTEIVSKFIVLPQQRDPLDYEVAEAFDDLAEWKGAKGWIANCPDQVADCIAASMQNGKLYLSRFNECLQTLGGCHLEVVDGVLRISPSRPIKSLTYQLNRNVLGSLLSSWDPMKGFPLYELCRYYFENGGFSSSSIEPYFASCLSKSKVLYDENDNKVAECNLALLGAIPRPYWADMMRGHDVIAPLNSDVLEQLENDGYLRNLFPERLYGATSTREFNDDSLFAIRSDVDSRIEVKTVTKELRVKRLRNQTVKGKNVIVDDRWINSQSIANLVKQDIKVPADYSRHYSLEEIKTQFKFLLAVRRGIEVNVVFPSGMKSKVIHYYIYDHPSEKPLSFDELPKELQNSVNF